MQARRWLPWAAVLLVLLAAGVIRFRLLETPLERDEGEYAYVGQLMLQGIPPFQLAGNLKLPGTYAAYALSMAAFGQTIFGIHLGLLLANAAAIVLVALLGMRLFGTASGIAAGAAYALMSVGSSVMGTQAHATHFVVLPALGGALLLLRHADSRRLATLWWSGLLFGLAFVMKQPGILFGVFGVFYLAAIERRQWRKMPGKLMVFGCALAAPFGLLCLVLWRAGVFDKFWFWTFTYARAHASQVPLSLGATYFVPIFLPILAQNGALWVLAAAGLVRLWWQRDGRPSAAFATWFLVFSGLAVCPGLVFRAHYFVLLLPAVALLVGAALRERLSYCAFGAALMLSLFMQRELLFQMSPVEVSRAIYGQNPFPEAIPVAAYIRAHSPDNSSIAVLGSEPEICFYAGRRSATSYIHVYGLMEPPYSYAVTMQEDMIREVAAAAPEFVVEASTNASWGRKKNSPTLIVEWWEDYRRLHYRRVGVADIYPDDTEYRWDAEAEERPPVSNSSLIVYRRTDAPTAASRGTN